MAGVQGQRPVQIVTDTGDSAMDDTNNAVRVNVVTGAGSGMGTSSTDEASYTPTSSAGTPVMGAVDEVAADAAAEGTLAIIRSTTTRALHVNLRDSTGAEITGSGMGGTQYTEDAAAAANPVGNAVILVRADSLAAVTTDDGDNVAVRGTNKGEMYVKHADAIPVTDNSSSLTVDNAQLSVVGSGTEAAALRVTIASDSTGLISVDDNGSTLSIDDGGGNISIDDGGNTITVDGTVGVTQATASNLNAQVVGDVAHDSGDSGNPLKVGGKAIAYGTNPTAVTANDRTNWYFNRHGIPFVTGGHPNIITRSVRITDANGAQTDASIVGTINAGTKVAVTEIQTRVSNACSVNVDVLIGFGTANVPTPSSTGAAGILIDELAVAPGSGSVRGNGTAVIGIGADGEELRLTCSDPTSGHLTVNFSYFTIES